MDYRTRQKAEQRHKSARFNRFLRRMEKTEESEEGQTVATICRDETRRMAGRTGTEGAFVEACREVKVAIVSVMVPKSPDAVKARRQVEATMGGMELDRDLAMTEFIGYDVAAARYSRRSVDGCERTMAAKIGAMQAG